MRKIDPTVLKETRYIAGWSLLLSAVMEVVFWALGRMDYTVPLGNLLGLTASVLNFLLMGITIQQSIGLEEKEASAKLKRSQKLRVLMVMVFLAVGVALPCFQSVTVVVPLFFPRIAIAFRPLLDKRKSDS